MKTSLCGKVAYCTCICYLAVAWFVMLSTCHQILTTCPNPEQAEVCHRISQIQGRAESCHWWCDFCMRPNWCVWLPAFLHSLSFWAAGAGTKELVLLSWTRPVAVVSQWIPMKMAKICIDWDGVLFRRFAWLWWGFSVLEKVCSCVDRGHLSEW